MIKGSNFVSRNNSFDFGTVVTEEVKSEEPIFQDQLDINKCEMGDSASVYSPSPPNGPSLRGSNTDLFALALSLGMQQQRYYQSNSRRSSVRSSSTDFKTNVLSPQVTTWTVVLAGIWAYLYGEKFRLGSLMKAFLVFSLTYCIMICLLMYTIATEVYNINYPNPLRWCFRLLGWSSSTPPVWNEYEYDYDHNDDASSEIIFPNNMPYKYSNGKPCTVDEPCSSPQGSLMRPRLWSQESYQSHSGACSPTTSPPASVLLDSDNGPISPGLNNLPVSSEEPVFWQRKMSVEQKYFGQVLAIRN